MYYLCRNIYFLTMKIGIIIAMDKEFRRISELLGNLKVETDGNWTFTTGSLGESEIVLH